MSDTTTVIESGANGISVHETVDGLADGYANEQQTDDTPAKKEKKKKKSFTPNKADKHIWGIYIVLLIFSVVELFSASSREITGNNVYDPLIRHGQFLLFGFLLVLVLQRIHYKWFRKFAWPVAIISLVLLIYSVKFGLKINGAQRAIPLGPFGTFQPAEMVKLTCMLLLATILAKYQTRGGVTTKGVLYSAGVVVAFSLLAWKNGLTNTVLIMGVSLSMFIIGGIRWKAIIAVILVYGVAGGILYMTKYSDDKAEDNDRTELVSQTTTNTTTIKSVNDEAGDRSATHVSRISAWLDGVNPGDTINDRNRQAMLAHFAQAHGGVTGRGIGKSRENSRLPLAFSDYIFSIIIEETGFVGGIVVMLIYLSLVARAGKIASQCSRAFPAFLIMGCAVLIVFQALIHMSIVTGLAPVSGQPLPFISKGGTSVIVMSIAIGMMLSVSRFAVRNGTKKQITAELDDLPHDMQSDNPSLIKTDTK